MKFGLWVMLAVHLVQISKYFWVSMFTRKMLRVISALPSVYDDLDDIIIYHIYDVIIYISIIMCVKVGYK